jgi:hypothetical protein
MKSLHLLGSGDLPLEVVIPAAIGNILWVILYIIALLHAPKNKFMEIPIFVITGDLVWEALYGFVLPYDPSVGIVMQYGIKAWCVMDCLILFFALKYAASSISTPLILKYIIPITLALLVSWTAIIYTMADAGMYSAMDILTKEDLVREAMSAYLLNIAISYVYIFQYLRLYNQQPFLTAVAWLKMFGTGLTTVSVYLNKPFNLLLFTLGVLVFAADIVYIVLLRVLPNKIQRASETGVAASR